MAKESVKFEVGGMLSDWNGYEAGVHEVEADAELLAHLEAAQAAGVGVNVLEGHSKLPKEIEPDKQSVKVQESLSDEQVRENRAVGALETARNQAIADARRDLNEARRLMQEAKSEKEYDRLEALADEMEVEVDKFANKLSEKLTKAIEIVTEDPDRAEFFAHEARGMSRARRHFGLERLPGQEKPPEGEEEV